MPVAQVVLGNWTGHRTLFRRPPESGGRLRRRAGSCLPGSRTVTLNTYVKPMSPALVLAGSVVVAALSIFGVMDYYRVAAIANAQNPDMYRLTHQGPRFREAISEVPEDAIVGYDTNVAAGSMADDVAFRGTQFAIAPRILRRVTHGEHGEFVIGNYTADVETADMVSRAASELGLELVRDFGAGVALYRKQGAN